MPKISHKVKQSYIDELLSVIQKVSRDSGFLRSFLIDLLTPEEFEKLALRWQIVKQLHRDMSQRDISRELKVSIATITRGARVLRNKQGGFNRVLNRL